MFKYRRAPRRMQDALRMLRRVPDPDGFTYLKAIEALYGVKIMLEPSPGLFAEAERSGETRPLDDTVTLFCITWDPTLTAEAIAHTLRHEGTHVARLHWGPPRDGRPPLFIDQPGTARIYGSSSQLHQKVTQHRVLGRDFNWEDQAEVDAESFALELTARHERRFEGTVGDPHLNQYLRNLVAQRDLGA